MRSILKLALIAAFAVSGSALAQDYDEVPPAPPPEPPYIPGTGPADPPAPPGSPRRAIREARERDRDDRYEPRRGDRPGYIRSWVGLGFQGGGGAGTFFDDEVRDMTSAQGAWAARFMVGTRTHLAGEAAYLGSAQKINALGLDSGAALVSHGAETALRLNLFTGVFQPYFAGGIGWRRFNVYSDFNTSALSDQTDVIHFPLATGLAIRGGGFMVDGRLTFRPTYGGFGPATNLSTWDITGNMGFEF